MTDTMETSVTEVQPSETADQGPAVAGRLTNVLCGSVVVAVGVIGILEALRLQLGTLINPTAGTWPAIISVILLIVGVLIVVKAGSFADAETVDRHVLRVVIGVASLVVAAMLMPVIGFEVPAFLLLLFWMVVIGRERALLSAAVSAGTVAIFYAIFVFGLNVPIPRLF